MPYTSQRKRQLQDARKTKVQKRGESSKEESQASSSLESSTLLENLEDYDTEQDEEYDPETEEFDEESSIQTHAHEWADSLCRDDLMSLTLLLHSLLVYRLHFPLTEAAKLISEMVSVSKGTV